MKIFSKAKFIKEEGWAEYERHKDWVDLCEGKTPARCKPYMVSDSWCIDDFENAKEKNIMYTMDDFIKKPIAVRVGQKHKREFLKMCADKGLMWKHSNTKAMQFIPPDVYGDDLCITLHCEYGNGGLMYGRKDTYERQQLTIVDFKDFKVKSESRYQIIIDCDGKTTTAKMMVNGKEVKNGVAKYNPADKFDFSIGAKVAFDRLWGKEVIKPKEEPKREFKVGDRVKCVGDKACKCKGVIGKQGTVKNCDFVGVEVKFDKKFTSPYGGKRDCWWLSPDDLIHID